MRARKDCLRGEKTAERAQGAKSRKSSERLARNVRLFGYVEEVEAWSVRWRKRLYAYVSADER
jgi:hypothetical protein